MSSLSSSPLKKTVRRARRAGSWYNGSQQKLNEQLTNWLQKAGDKNFGPAKAIISPHAGYEHCGSCAAFAFKEIDPSITRRIFILGPSHNVRLNGIALSSAQIYQTPLGDLTIDQEVYDELKATKLFEKMSLRIDEEEHSLELQLPYIYKVMETCPEPYTIVPMMVGGIKADKEIIYGKLLSKYFAKPENLFVISSDFCHWGERFDYVFYVNDWGFIYESIEKLDKLGMVAIKKLKHQSFADYLKEYGNTICGRHPIGVLLAAIENLNSQSIANSSTPNYNIKFLNYKQSSSVNNFDDSSVSYVAASVKEFGPDSKLEPIADITRNVITTNGISSSRN